jgi:general secretion pathway protein J
VNAGKLGGFTLLEMVVALALMSMIGATLFVSLRFAQRTFDRIAQTDNSIAELAAGQTLLRALLEGAYPFALADGVATPTILEGRRNEISFTSASTHGAGGNGYHRYKLFLRSRPDAYFDVVLQWSWDRNGATIGMPSGEEVILSKIDGLEWAYLMEKNTNRLWLDEWREPATLPSAIRLRVKFANADPRHWPELLVATKLTDDANCEFDVVAQGCRGATP